MKSPQEPFDNPESAHSDTDAATEPDFGQALAAVERSLQALKERYTQVQQDQQTQWQLQERQAQLKQQLDTDPAPALKTELNQIQAQLDELEFKLESQLFSFSSLKEPFWQIIRFGGLGLAIGWGLALVVLNAPRPTPPDASPPPNQQQPY